MIIRIVGEQEWVKTKETTVSGASRVYVSWAKSSVEPEHKFIEQKKLTDRTIPYNASTNPYVSIGKIYMTQTQGIMLQKDATDVFVANTGSQVISATPIFTPAGALAE